MDDPRKTARQLIAKHEITLERLWLRYWAEGGNASEPEFDAFVHGALRLPRFDLRVLTWAMEDLDTSSAH
ncbi:hypothetical protein [Arthrobacter sp. StoSoilB5]|uniref:hypothetical protein n=1 Tax=Arthrobacter sp. StoSoilB5 TaxID=2830992 RepID=UPI001CC52C2C|nr:hypothetical protein [Arthrobacter sp. StoSoilB5]BCW45320.1 hypothetical protein StoSoilB5_25040 [Arthrobacter sp. StoSoilB5]